MMKQLLAVDIGAGSGRVIRGSFENNRLTLKEDARFSNPLLTDHEGFTYWDFNRLSEKISDYLLKNGEADSIGFDSFSPDFGIFDRDGKLCHEMLSYHNYFQTPFPEQVLREYSEDDLHNMCGNPPSPIGVLARLCWLQERYAYAADENCTLLPMADALAFTVSGEKYTDFTFSFDCGIGNLTGEWEERLTRFLKVGKSILPQVLPCGELVGYSRFSTGKRTAVINTALHDTASAYYALKLLADGQLSMNAGTWFSIGVVADSPVLTPLSKELGTENIALPDRSFIHGHTFPGAWFLQTYQKEKGGIPFAEMSAAARNEQRAYISADVSDMSRYQGTDGLIKTVRKDMENSGIEHPDDLQVLRSIYEGLADAVSQAAANIERISSKHFDEIYMSGGVTKDGFLCSLIQEKSGKRIITCMREASAAGNLLLQLQGLKLTGGEDQSRELLKNIKE